LAAHAFQLAPPSKPYERGDFQFSRVASRHAPYGLEFAFFRVQFILLGFEIASFSLQSACVWSEHAAALRTFSFVGSESDRELHSGAFRPWQWGLALRE
jgi:hypothetical protein